VGAGVDVEVDIFVGGGVREAVKVGAWVDQAGRERVGAWRGRSDAYARAMCGSAS
jgi:hypothetical protein